MALKNFHLKIKKKRKSAFCASVYVQHFLCSSVQINLPFKVSLWWHNFLFDSEITRHYLAFLQQVSSISDEGPNSFLILLLSPVFNFTCQTESKPK